MYLSGVAEPIFKKKKKKCHYNDYYTNILVFILQ